MFTVNRNTLKEYAESLKGLTNEELHKEIWMLDEHIHVLMTTGGDVRRFERFLYVAKEEKEMRMVAQGYQ